LRRQKYKEEAVLGGLSIASLCNQSQGAYIESAAGHGV